MKKIVLIAILIVSAAFSIAAAQPPTTGSQSSLFRSVTDNAQLLTEDEAQVLTTKVQSLETKHGTRIGIVTLKSARGQNIHAVADSLLDSYFADAKNGSIALVVVMDTREWYISTEAQMKRRITNEAGIPYLQEQFVSMMSQGNFYAAFNSYLDAVDSLLTYYEQNEKPYDPNEGFNPMAAMMAVVIAIVIAGFVRSSMIAAMSNVRTANEAIDYLDKNSVKLIESRDMFLFMNVTRQAKNRGGSRPSGGGSSGGGGHGGGGGSF